MQQTFQVPACLATSKVATKAWHRATAGLPDNPPAAALAICEQIAKLLVQEDRYHRARKPPEDWKPADWHRALRETVKLRSDLVMKLEQVLRGGGRVPRALPTAKDPDAPSRSSGVVKLLQGEKPSTRVN